MTDKTLSGSRRFSYWAVMLTFAIAAVVFEVTPALALRWSRQPFPGFVIGPALVLNNFGGDEWNGVRAGLRYPENVVRVNGQAIHTFADFKETIAATQVGTTISVETVSPDGQTRFYPAIEVSSFRVVDMLRMFWLTYVVGLAYLAIGAFVYRLRGESRPARAFAFYCACSSLTVATIFDIISTHAVTQIWTTAVAMVGGTLISLAMLFPEEWEPVKNREWLRYLPYAIPVPLAAWGLWAQYAPSGPWAVFPVIRVSYVYAVIGIVTFLVVTVYRLLRSKSPLARQQALVILLGSALALAPIWVWFVVATLQLPVWFNTLVFVPPLLLMPLAIAVAILRYRLWDIDIILNRALVYSALTGTLAVIFFGSLLPLQQVLREFTGQSSPVPLALSTLAIAVVFTPLRRRIQADIDRRFYRGKYDLQQTLAAFGSTLRDEVKLDRLTTRLLNIVQDTMQPSHASLWLANEPPEDGRGGFMSGAGGNRLTPAQGTPRPSAEATFDIAPGDPLVALLEKGSEAVDLRRLDLPSPALAAMKHANTELAVPLISQGELVGLLGMGPRLSETDYSTKDRRLLNMLATQAAPAVRVGQLVRQQRAEARKLERLDYEMQLAQVIQKTLLPREAPTLPGWRLTVHYQPAQAIGGDLYDFLPLEDGRLALVIGDVTDHGIPAALVMASARATLRGAARRLLSPGEALERSNTLLWPEMPANMYVTCIYAILDPASGRLQFANAGHVLPIHRSKGTASELRATGMPLGLMPGSRYEEVETTIAPGECLLLYSDGLVEARDAAKEMFGAERLHKLLTQDCGRGVELIECLMDGLADFGGEGWEQEDDVTVLALQRCREGIGAQDEEGWKTLDEFALPSQPGNERVAAERVGKAVAGLALPAARLEGLKTAVAEAAMNGMEHGGGYQADNPVTFRVQTSPGDRSVVVRIADSGRGGPIQAQEPPNLEAKLAGRQPPRGWGFYLMRRLVDEVRIGGDDTGHVVELVMCVKGI